MSAIAVRDRRVFYVTTDYPQVTIFGTSIAPADVSPVSPVMLQTIAFAGGQLTRLPAQELHRVANNAPIFYTGELYARGERASRSRSRGTRRTGQSAIRGVEVVGLSSRRSK